MNKPIAFALALLAAASAQAQNNFTGAANTPWATATNWSAGVPTSAQDVVSANGSTVRIQGTAAQAGNLTIGGSSTGGVQIVGSVANSSLTVAGSITLAPGAGAGSLNLGTGGSNATLTIAGGSGSILDGVGAGNSQIIISGHMGTLGLANATADQLLINQTTSGSLTIGAGQNYNILSTQGTQVGSGMANITTALTVNGTLVSRTLVVGAAAASGANNATLTLNTGGLIRARDLSRNGSQTTTFDWNGGTIQNHPDFNLLVQGTSPNTLTINLAQAGTRTFQADSGRTITISNTAVLADKSGENGSLTKTGAGSLLLQGTNTYSGATMINAGSLILSTNGSIANSSVLDVSSGATLNVSAVTGGFIVGTNQTLRGGGTVVGNTTVNGALQPGNSPGLLSFTNNLTLESTAATTMEINGAGTRGMVYDAINVGGSLAYNGTLTLLIGTTFGVGNYNFDLFDSVSTSGTFSTVNLGGLYSGSLTNNGSGVWGLSKGNDTWTFNQSSGVLSVQSTGGVTPYAAWVNSWSGFTQTAGTDDPDGDGYNNNMEFAFGTIPTAGSPALLRTATSGSQFVISWLQRIDSSTNYIVEEATDLVAGSWVVSSATVQAGSGATPPDGYERKQISVTPTGKKFYRVQAPIRP